MSSLESSQKASSQPPAEAPKSNSNQATNAPISPSLRWLNSCSQLFKSAEKDSKDVLCMVEVLQDRVLRTDVVISEMERALSQQVRDFITRQAQYCETVFANDAEVLKAIREADSVNAIVASQLESSQLMSHTLLQRITGIIESPSNLRAANTPNTSPAK